MASRISSPILFCLMESGTVKKIITRSVTGLVTSLALFGVALAQSGPAQSENLESRFWEQLYPEGGETFYCKKPFTQKTMLLTESHRSEEHTSELQSRENLVCRLLLEKKKKKQKDRHQ